jgi:hypothetical protein
VTLKTIFILFFLTSCSQETANSYELAFNLQSSMSTKEVTSIIEQKGGDWSIFEDMNISDDRPRYQLISIKTRIFKYKNFNGVTILEFFNDKLLSVTFYPSRQKRFVSLQQNSFKKNINVNIVFDKNIENKLYIKWIDKKLEQILQNWLNRYS